MKTHDLRISPIFLDSSLPREANTAGPLYSTTCDTLGDDTRPVLGHRSLLRELAPFVLPPRGVICQKTRCLDVDCSFSDLELHALERPYGLAKLRPLVSVGHGFVESALSETEHLGGNADTSYTPTKR